MKKAITPSWNDIANLQREAAQAGDRACYILCKKALVQVCMDHPRRFKAFRQVERILATAAAQAE